jgi:hypothetical protein
LTEDNPLPNVVEAYRRVTGADALAIGKRNTSGDILVPCVAKQNHKHGDATPSLRINLDKDAWICDPCRALGIDGGRATHLVVAAGIAANLTDASKWLAPRQDIEKPAPPPPPPDRQKLAAEYDYKNADGIVLYQVRRFEWINDDGTKGKTFSQRRALASGGWESRLGDVERVPYRWPETSAAISEGRTIYVVEGEKDADTLWSKGLAATTNAGGAGWAWTAEFVEFFRSATTVVVIGDNDLAGRAAARARADAICLVAPLVFCVEAIPSAGPKGDVTDWFADHPNATAVEFRKHIATAAKQVGPEIDDGHVNALPLALIHRRLLQTQNQVVPAVPFSIPTLDERLGGMQIGRVTILASRTNQGKTALAVRIATLASTHAPVLVMSLEMGQAQWHDRIGASGEDMTIRQYRDEKRPDSVDAWWWDSHRMYVAPGGRDASVARIEELILLHQPKLVIVDHLRHVKGWMPTGSKRADLAASEVMYEFSEMAKKRKVHFLLLHQLSRPGADEPKLEHLRDAGAVEEVADNVILLHRPFKTIPPGDQRSEANEDNVMHAYLAKSREAGEVLVHLRWVGRTMEAIPLRPDQLAHFSRCCG